MITLKNLLGIHRMTSRAFAMRFGFAFQASERGTMLISLDNAKRERSLKRLHEIVEKNLAKVDCRTRAEFEKGLEAPDGGQFIAMSGAVFIEDHKLVEQYFERYFDELTPERRRHVAQFFAVKYFGPVRI